MIPGAPCTPLFTPCLSSRAHSSQRFTALRLSPPIHTSARSQLINKMRHVVPVAAAPAAAPAPESAEAVSKVPVPFSDEDATCVEAPRHNLTPPTPP